MFFRRPVSHGAMTNHGRKMILEERKARRAVREAADVSKRFPQQAFRSAHQSAMQRAADGRDEGEDEAFGRLRLEESEIVRRDQVADEEAAARTGSRARRFKPVAAQAAAALRASAEATEVRRGKRADPAHRGDNGRGLTVSCTCQ